MNFINGVNLLPSTGEFTYGTTARQGCRALPTVTPGGMTGVNYFYNGSPSAATDYSVSINQLLADFPACQTVAVVCAWFGSSTDVTACKIYPSTTYWNPYSVAGCGFQKWNGSGWTAENWQCSSLIQTSPGIIPISLTGETYDYGGTPSDQSIVECVQDLKSRGLRVVFYPFILMDDGAKSWRGQIAYSGADVSSAASAAVANFLGSAATSQFTRDTVNKTVAYSGSSTDYTYRRMILHYANLCVIAGGVDLFILGSELRGLESVRGPRWTAAGSGSPPTWDYPFVNGIITLSDDVRSVFNGAGLTKDLTGFHNLISYAADWSSWMGMKHDSANPPTGFPNGAQWPHLDQLWSHSNIDLVCFDNYLPMSDWTTGGGGIDVLNWSEPPPTSWPPGPATMSGLGLTGLPTIYSSAYLKANIEGGERFNWYYNDSNNLGLGIDPNGTDMRVSVPEGDRLTQSRNQFYANQEILGQKQIRWWWNNQHFALWDAGGGAGLVPQGSATGWVPQSKSIVFTEYGFPSNDKSTNQPNVFFSPGSIESDTAFWSIWDPAVGGGVGTPGTWWPRQDQRLQLLALQSFYEYWFADTPSKNETSGAGVQMLFPPFCSVWNWDARPFPIFPALADEWGDTRNWRAGNWLGGKGPYIPYPLPDPPPGVPMPVGNFPSLPGLSWSVHKRPTWSTRVASHVSGREVRNPFYSVALYEFELTIEGLDSAGGFTNLGAQSMQSLWGLYLQCQGQANTFLYTDPTDNAATGQTLGTGDGSTTIFTAQRAVGAASEPVNWLTSITLYKTDWQGKQVQYTAPRTNLLKESAAINVSPWGAGGVTITANSTTAPDGSTTADTLSDGSSTGIHLVDQAPITITAGAEYTFSAYFKYSSHQYVELIFDNSTSNGFAYCFDLVNGTHAASLVIGSASAASASIVSLGGGWYRCSISGFLGPADTTARCSIVMTNSSTSTWYPSYTGGNTSFYCWGAQFEKGGIPTSYIPTISAAVTVTDYSLGPAPNQVTFTTAPATGNAITADMQYAYNCRFVDDQEDFEEFMNGLWKVESLKFRSVKP